MFVAQCLKAYTPKIKYHWIPPVKSFLPDGGTHQHRPKNAHTPAAPWIKSSAGTKNDKQRIQFWSIIFSTLARPQQVTLDGAAMIHGFVG